MRNRLIALIAVLAIVIVSSGIFLASAADYSTPQVTDITVPSTGTVHIDQNATAAGSLSMDIVATPGTTGSVTTATYQANPNPTATVPDNTQLTTYIAVSFSIPANQFTSATLVFNYDSSNPAPILCKLSADGTTFTPMTNAVVDTTAHTITVTLTSTTDPLFAIGQSNASPTPTTNSTDSTLLYAAVAIVVIVVIAVVGIYLVKRPKA